MTRKKKSRKPGLAPLSASKDDKKIANVADKKPKKHKGKVSGNRQKEALKTNKNQPSAKTNKDPRIGSKKPIVLGNELNTTKAKTKTPAKKKVEEKPLAAIRVVDNQNELHQELEAIENDSKLQEILSKQEDDIILTEDEVDYFNEKMERHQAISEQLGLDQEEALDVEQSDALDEEALWDKLDKTNLSDYES
ncbi:Der GTPase-activating protein YihI [Thalassotalea ganghwensis]